MAEPMRRRSPPNASPASMAVRRWRARISAANPRPLLGRLVGASGDRVRLDLAAARVGDLVAFGPPWPATPDEGLWAEITALSDGAAEAAPDGAAAPPPLGALVRAGAPRRMLDPTALWGARVDCWGQRRSPEAAPGPPAAAAAPADWAAGAERIAAPFARAEAADAWTERLAVALGAERTVAAFLRIGADAAADRLRARRGDALVVAAGPERPDVERRRAVRTAASFAARAAESGARTLLVVDDAADAAAADARLSGGAGAPRFLAGVAARARPGIVVALGADVDDAGALRDLRRLCQTEAPRAAAGGSEAASND